MADANPHARGIGVGLDLIPVTPNDSADLPAAGRAIRCRPDGAAGTVRFMPVGGETLRNTAIAAGETINVAVQRVHATGTTATNLEVLT